MSLKLEFGGGLSPRGDGFLSLDLIDSADLQIDLAAVGREQRTLPYSDDSVDEVYSSHFLEHIAPYHGLLRETVRVCRPGARVEFRVPHWNQSMALCAGHKHAISEQQVDQWSEFAEVWWKGCSKRLQLMQTDYVPSQHYEEAQRLFPHLSDHQVFRFLADTCHEIGFIFRVVPSGA